MIASATTVSPVKRRHEAIHALAESSQDNYVKFSPEGKRYAEHKPKPRKRRKTSASKQLFNTEADEESLTALEPLFNVVT